MKKKDWLRMNAIYKTAFLLLALIITACNKSPERPNIILISIDTLRADHLSCYGYREDLTPNIDLFREDSILFWRCYSQAPSTTPSHASMFTSLIPSHHGSYFTRQTSINPSALTIAEILKGSGYHTVSFNEGGQLDAMFGFGRGFDIYHTLEGYKSAPQPEFVLEKRIQDMSG